MVDDVVGSTANAFHFNFECLKTLMLTRSCLSSPHIHISNFFCIWRFSRDRKLVVIEGVKDIGVIRKSWNHLIRRRKWRCQVLLIFILEYFELVGTRTVMKIVQIIIINLYMPPFILEHVYFYASNIFQLF